MVFELALYILCGDWILLPEVIYVLTSDSSIDFLKEEYLKNVKISDIPIIVKESKKQNK